MPEAPRIPRDRELGIGEVIWMVITVGAVLCGAGFLLVRWVWS